MVRPLYWLYWLCVSSPCVLRPPHMGPTVGRLKRLERLGRGRQQICLVCSGASEAFGAARTLSDPTEHGRSEEVGRRTSEPLGRVAQGQKYTLMWSWQNIKAPCSVQLLCRTGQTRGNRAVREWSDKGACVGAFRDCNLSAVKHYSWERAGSSLAALFGSCLWRGCCFHAGHHKKCHTVH